MATSGWQGTRDLRSAFVGVIDLQDGRAVHGIGGQRDRYRPTRFFYRRGQSRVPIDGDSCRLAACYRQVGVTSLYVADLDGIRTGRWQTASIDSVVRHAVGPVFLDLGQLVPMSPRRRRWIESLLSDHLNVTLVVATECAPSVAVLDELTDHISHQRIAVSFDYRDARWMSQSTSPSEWIDACRRKEIATTIGLDLSAVGGVCVEQTEALCRRLRSQLPTARYITGGGIRSDADALRLLHAGADALLVASLFAR